MNVAGLQDRIRFVIRPAELELHRTGRRGVQVAQVWDQTEDRRERRVLEAQFQIHTIGSVTARAAPRSSPVERELVEDQTALVINRSQRAAQRIAATGKLEVLRDQFDPTLGELLERHGIFGPAGHEGDSGQRADNAA